MVSGIGNMRSIEPTTDPKIEEIRERMLKWIDFCLIARMNDEDIFKLAPHLNNLLD